MYAVQRTLHSFVFITHANHATYGSWLNLHTLFFLAWGTAGQLRIYVAPPPL